MLIDNVETFYRTNAAISADRSLGYTCWNDPEFTEGWYWWFCQPGCLPDSDPIGPFETRQEALNNAEDY